MQRVNAAESCPSDLVLDEWFAAELKPDARAQLDVHLLACKHCDERVLEARQQRQSFLRAAPTFAAHARLSGRHVPRRHMADWLPGAVTGALALVAGLLLMLRASDELLPGTRIKGRPQLGFYVKRGERVELGVSGDRVNAGDQLHFSYSSPLPTHLAVLGWDGARAALYYPEVQVSEALIAGSARLLDFAIDLDDSPGEQRIIGVFCQAAFDPEALRVALGRSGRLPTREGCTSDTIVLDKGTRP